jgi:hypothetical protein
MSIYRPVDRQPLSDVHHVPGHVVGNDKAKQPPDESSHSQHWTKQRRTLPPEPLLPSTTRWIETLPQEFQPTAIGATFPRIANALASRWATPESLTSYLNDLLVDTRGGRRGFPVKVLRELHALRALYAGLHPHRSDLWSRSTRAR